MAGVAITTMNKRDTVPIIYLGGTYGTFVHWCLEYFSGMEVIERPFDKATGSSHNFVGGGIRTLPSWRTYLDTEPFQKIVRIHPKTKIDKEGSLINNINQIITDVDSAILLSTNKDSSLWILNNKLEKIYKGGVDGWAERQNISTNLQQWGRNSVSEMEVWEMREFLSMYLMAHHYGEFEFERVQEFSSEKLLKIHILDLVNNFETTIRKMMEYCSLPVKRENFSQVHEEWLSTQKHINKDAIVKKIIECVRSNEEYDWTHEHLTIADESIIQMVLRDVYKLDTLCYNLNVFPTNTIDLRKLLINV